MNTEILDILAKIVDGITKNQSIDKILETVNKNKKVNKNLIAAIYSWIFEKLTREINDRAALPDAGIRIFSAEEKDLLGLENCNYLLHLYNLGLLNNSDIDKIIEQASNFPEGDLDLEELNLMIISIFLETNSELPPGSRLLLHSSDTIN